MKSTDKVNITITAGALLTIWKVYNKNSCNGASTTNEWCDAADEFFYELERTLPHHALHPDSFTFDDEFSPGIPSRAEILVKVNEVFLSPIIVSNHVIKKLCKAVKKSKK